MLTREYCFKKCEESTLEEQFLKLSEEMQEVFVELKNNNKKLMAMELLDVIQAAKNTLIKLELEDNINFDDVYQNWINKMENYKTKKYFKSNRITERKWQHAS